MIKLTLTSLIFVISATACLKGKGELKRGTKESAVASVNVATREENGVIIGSLSANSNEIQVIKASSGSQVEGTEISFPPGSLAVDTEISIRIGDNIANDKVVNQLDLGTTVQTSSIPVEIKSSAPMDTIQPFTISLFLPDEGSALALADSYLNLSVLYSVSKVAQGNAPFIGVIPRSSLSIFGRSVAFQASFFGTYQAVITREPITVEKVLQTTPVSIVANGVKTFFAKGFLPVSGKTRAWAQPLSPSTVNSGTSTLRTNFQQGK